MVSSVAVIVGGSALFGTVLPAVVTFTGVLGRAMFIAGIVLVVLAVVRRVVISLRLRRAKGAASAAG